MLNDDLGRFRNDRCQIGLLGYALQFHLHRSVLAFDLAKQLGLDPPVRGYSQ